ncbi:Innexin inx2 like protein [Argiope bruennichi]|uniref:Innexin n=1 Tax=Argiope bruennichi TaxID=94029 RepID=A0A8T0EGG1_ARGBR|nr:Innexin inx2 like protein [Argiope bruennichi]
MDLFSSLKSFFKTDSTTIDNNVFRLHYKATSTVLVAFSILVTARQYIGDPIDCVPNSNIPPNLLDTFCWVHSTFSVPSSWNKEVGVAVPYPGVDNSVDHKDRKYHAYYQWVCFVLFLQAILFYIPRYFWKVCEGSRMKNLILGLNTPCLDKEVKDKSKKLLVDYIIANLHNHNVYFTSYVFCEVMNFVNVIGQIYLIDTFLDGEFTKYGLKVIQFTGWEGAFRYDPMIHVFPRVTKCLFYVYGTGGSVEKKDTMCILPINIINEKIYIFIWFWFIILAVLSALVLVYRLVLVFWPNSRFMVTTCRARLVKHDHLRLVLSRASLGDWFILDMLSKNVDSMYYKEIIVDLADRLDGKGRHGNLQSLIVQ